MRNALTLAAILILPAVVMADTLIVPDDYLTIQLAIDASANGDVVSVKPGTYTENIDFQGKAITVIGSGGAGVTAIDGNQAGSVVTFEQYEGLDSVLEGFTLTNGTGTYFEQFYGSWVHGGGGLFCKKSSPRITGIIFSGNSADIGGGMYTWGDGHPMITGCTFTVNTAKFSGGLNSHESSVTLTDCNFINNLASQDGGGMSGVDSDTTLVNCSFTDNSTLTSYGDGGGVFLRDGATEITGCSFSGNSAHIGGGINNLICHGTITDCVISDNLARGVGGGLYDAGGNLMLTHCSFSGNSTYNDGGGIYTCTYSELALKNCIFRENTAARFGGGLYEDCNKTTATNCTFHKNSAKWGGGIFTMAVLEVNCCTFFGNTASKDGGGLCNWGGTPSAVNCVFWSDSPDELVGIPDVRYSCVQGGHPGSANILDDPLFVDPAGGDFHLTWRSPCINRGLTDEAPPIDFDLDFRPFMGSADMGADEFVGTHSLEVDLFTISAQFGGTNDFSLTAGTTHAGRYYLIFGSMTGTAPGFALPGGLATLPITWDVSTDFILSNVNTPFFSDFLGVIDAGGKASARLYLPAIPSSMVGLRIYYAFAMNNPWDFASNPVEIEIVP